MPIFPFRRFFPWRISNKDLLSLQYSTSFSLSGMEEANIDLQLSVAPPPPSTLTGVVTDGETLVATTKTNSEGKYLFGGVLAGDYLVKAKLEQ